MPKKKIWGALKALKGAISCQRFTATVKKCVLG